MFIINNEKNTSQENWQPLFTENIFSEKKPNTQTQTNTL